MTLVRSPAGAHACRSSPKDFELSGVDHQPAGHRGGDATARRAGATLSGYQEGDENARSTPGPRTWKVVVAFQRTRLGIVRDDGVGFDVARSLEGRLDSGKHLGMILDAPGARRLEKGPLEIARVAREPRSGVSFEHLIAREGRDRRGHPTAESAGAVRLTQWGGRFRVLACDLMEPSPPRAWWAPATLTLWRSAAKRAAAASWSPDAPTPQLEMVFDRWERLRPSRSSENGARLLVGPSAGTERLLWPRSQAGWSRSCHRRGVERWPWGGPSTPPRPVSGGHPETHPDLGLSLDLVVNRAEWSFSQGRQQALGCRRGSLRNRRDRRGVRRGGRRRERSAHAHFSGCGVAVANSAGRGQGGADLVLAGPAARRDRTVSSLLADDLNRGARRPRGAWGRCALRPSPMGCACQRVVRFQDRRRTSRTRTAA